MGAFSFIISKVLFLSCGLTFGADFSPSTWEPVRRAIEQLATKLFEDKSLVAKHRKHLDQLKWSKRLDKKLPIVPAHETSRYPRVIDEDGNVENTPHHLFVDDDIYAEVYDRSRIEQATAAGIEAVFILLGEPAIELRQDSISWEKLFEMIINSRNIILGQDVDTNAMTIGPPHDYVQQVVQLIKKTWHKGRLGFLVSEAETLAGQLGHIATTVPWLRHLMSHVYTSIA
ncbi:hypothetical protein ACHAWF_007337, partial [Thalassiosira exigua]